MTRPMTIREREALARARMNHAVQYPEDDKPMMSLKYLVWGLPLSAGLILGIVWLAASVFG